MFYEFPYVFLNNLQCWHFLYCFGFNLKKKKLVEKVNIYNQQLNIQQNIWRSIFEGVERLCYEHIICEPFDCHLPNQNGIWMKFAAQSFIYHTYVSMPQVFFWNSSMRKPCHLYYWICTIAQIKFPPFYEVNSCNR